MKNIFNSVSIYFGKNSLLANIRDKCVTRNTNVFFLDITKNRQVLASKVCHFQYDHRFLFRSEMGNIRMCVQGDTSKNTYQIWIVRIVFVFKVIR